MSQDNGFRFRHAIAVVGAATAGAEIARILAEHGSLVIVIEQNPRPYGKIEDGLPRWHVKQRLEEYEKIRGKLSHPNIEFVPMTRMGRDVSFEELRTEWGLNAIVLCNGAWRDRPFPVEGADRYVGKGLIYQNAFIYWFNHYLETGYSGPRFMIEPGGLVIGGGLASIDVVKVLQIEVTLRALAARGIQEDMLRIEREGIEPVLGAHELRWSDLNVAPCRLYYRRRVLDMPLSDIPTDANPKRAEAMRQARAKILEKAQRKFLFDFYERSVPTGLIVEGERLVGLRISRTEIVDGKPRIIEGSEQEVRGPFVISSIGSIPEPIEGIPVAGETYRYINPEVGLLMEGSTAVFAAGNVLTGKGNIKDSLDSGTGIGIQIAESYLGLTADPLPLDLGARERAAQEAELIAREVDARRPLSPEQIEALLVRVRKRQREIGYDGDFARWIGRVTPADMQ
jgi:ferredoxin--NADP+ reductase